MYSSSNILSNANENFYIQKKNKYFYRNVYLHSDHWKNLRKEKLVQISICEKCKTIHNLDVHHINYKGLYDVKLSDLQVLCRKCHEEEHIKKKPQRQNLKILNRNKRASELKMSPIKNKQQKKKSVFNTYVSIHY
jgi:5-methylcytosine-specific restriction endonuclease McrA